LLTPARKRNEKWNVCFVLFEKTQQKREAEDREREKRIEEECKNAGPSAKALEIRRLMDKLGPKGLRITEVPTRLASACLVVFTRSRVAHLPG
jgi:hypothetical protein